MQTITYMKQAQRRMTTDPRSKSKQRPKNKMNATVDNVSLNQSLLFPMGD